MSASLQQMPVCKYSDDQCEHAHVIEQFLRTQLEMSCPVKSVRRPNRHIDACTASLIKQKGQAMAHITWFG
eukprot:9361814-Karenia_brevis.AAC.1